MSIAIDFSGIEARAKHSVAATVEQGLQYARLYHVSKRHVSQAQRAVAITALGWRLRVLVTPRQ